MKNHNVAENEIVVTGIGVFTSIGCNKNDFWNALVSGKSGATRIQSFNPEGHLSQIASEIHNFNPVNYMNPKQARKMARFSQLATCAAIEAVKDANLNLEKENPFRVGCVIGSAAGDYENIEDQFKKFHENGPGSVNPFSIPKIIPNMASCNTSIVLKICGPNMGTSAACATGTFAIGLSMDMLRNGRADVILAGGTESTITPIVIDGYATMRTLSRRNNEPQKASRPFDANRDGFVIGEGAGVLVLETLKHARNRGAEPLAILKGFGMSSDAYSMALPLPDGKMSSMAAEDALRDARLNKTDIGYINAHGTSTKVNDKVESITISNVFGESSPPVSSNKSMIGHTLGAAGAIEAAATVLSVKHGILPPNINYETKDPDINLDIIAGEAREIKIKAAISNSFGFGGQNGVLVFEKY